MELPARKHPRLKEYDYGQNGAYFVMVLEMKYARPVPVFLSGFGWFV